MKKYVSVLLILTLLLTVIQTTNVLAKAKKYNENLTAGEYLVGDDIPVGKYNLTGINNWGFIQVYKSEKDYDNDASAKKTINLCSEDLLDDYGGLYQLSYKNIKLKKGYYVVITSSLEVNFKQK